MTKRSFLITMGIVLGIIFALAFVGWFTGRWEVQP